MSVRVRAWANGRVIGWMGRRVSDRVRDIHLLTIRVGGGEKGSLSTFFCSKMAQSFLKNPVNSTNLNNLSQHKTVFEPPLQHWDLTLKQRPVRRRWNSSGRPSAARCWPAPRSLRSRKRRKMVNTWRHKNRTENPVIYSRNVISLLFDAFTQKISYTTLNFGYGACGQVKGEMFGQRHNWIKTTQFFLSEVIYLCSHISYIQGKHTQDFCSVNHNNIGSTSNQSKANSPENIT